MKKVALFTLTLGALVGFSFVNVPVKVWQEAPYSIKDGSFRKINQQAFKPGEKLVFRVHYGWLEAGTATLELENSEYEYKGRDCYRIRGLGKSASSFEWFYVVRDVFDTYMDKDGVFPWISYREINEGDFHNADKARFNPEEGTVTNAKGVLKTEANTLDLMTAFYYSRTIDVRKDPDGTVYRFPVYMDNEIHQLGVKIIGRETINTEYGKLRCIKIQPIVVQDRLFKDQNMYVWVTDDRNQVPVKITSPIVVGSIEADVMSLEGLRYPLDCKE